MALYSGVMDRLSSGHGRMADVKTVCRNSQKVHLFSPSKTGLVAEKNLFSLSQSMSILCLVTANTPKIFRDILGDVGHALGSKLGPLRFWRKR